MFWYAKNKSNMEIYKTKPISSFHWKMYNLRFHNWQTRARVNMHVELYIVGHITFFFLLSFNRSFDIQPFNHLSHACRL